MKKSPADAPTSCTGAWADSLLRSPLAAAAAAGGAEACAWIPASRLDGTRHQDFSAAAWAVAPDPTADPMPTLVGTLGAGAAAARSTGGIAVCPASGFPGTKEADASAGTGLAGPEAAGSPRSVFSLVAAAPACANCVAGLGAGS